MIFVVGNSRSGTTMLGNVLGNHSRVYTFPELQVFERLIDPKDMSSNFIASEDKLVAFGSRIMTTIRDGVFCEGSPVRFEAEVKKIIKKHDIKNQMILYKTLLQYETKKAGKQIFCEQTPRYIFTASKILRAFPDACVIHIYRDPRDVMLSQKNRWRRRFLTDSKIPIKRSLVAWGSYHPSMTSRLWGAVMRQADKLKVSDRFFEIKYEQLLQDPEKGLKLLCRQLGINYESSMLNVRREGSSANQDETFSFGFDASRIGAWKIGGLSSTEIEICEKRLSVIMEYRGYECSNSRASILGRVCAAFSLPFKILANLIMNTRRFQSLSKTIIRRLNA